MRVLGIDPGLTRCGLGVVDFSHTRALTMADVGVVRTNPAQEDAERISQVGTTIEQWLARFSPDVIAMERVFAQHNLRTVMGIAQISGVALYIARQRDIPIVLYTPTQVKAAVSGYGRADKKQVQAMVTRILQLPETPQPADAADALAIAICHCWASPAPMPGPETGVVTPAQRMWRDAERRARK